MDVSGTGVLEFPPIIRSNVIRMPVSQMITDTGERPIERLEVYAGDYSDLPIAGSLIEASDAKYDEYLRVTDAGVMILADIPSQGRATLWYRMNFGYADTLEPVDGLEQTVIYEATCGWHVNQNHSCSDMVENFT